MTNGRLWLALMLGGAALLAAGCKSEACRRGPQPLTAKWEALKLPAVGQREVCYCDDKEIMLIHRDADWFELVDKYAEKFRSEGWEVGQVTNEYKARAFSISRGRNGKQIYLTFSDCLFQSFIDRRSKCSQVNVKDLAEK